MIFIEFLPIISCSFLKQCPFSLFLDYVNQSPHTLFSIPKIRIAQLFLLFCWFSASHYIVYFWLQNTVQENWRCRLILDEILLLNSGLPSLNSELTYLDVRLSLFVHSFYGWCLGLYRKGLCPIGGYGIPLCACFMSLFAMCSASQIFGHSIFLWLSPLVKAMWNIRFLFFLLYQMLPLLFSLLLLLSNSTTEMHLYFI